MDRKDLLTVVVIGGFVLLCTVLWILDARRTRRLGKSGSATAGAVGGIDDVFHPEAARASEIREVQRELPAEAPVAGDPFRLVMRPDDRSSGRPGDGPADEAGAGRAGRAPDAKPGTDQAAGAGSPSTSEE